MSRTCPQCQKENPSNANFCMYCSSSFTENTEIDELDVLHKELSEAKDTIKLLKGAIKETRKEEMTIESGEQKTVITQLHTPVSLPSKDIGPNKAIIKDKPFPNTILIVGLLLLLIIGGSVGYYAFYKPYAIDRDAPRFYTFAKNTVLRSSKELGVEYNKLESVPYGSELIVYDNGNDWSEVKWKNNQSNSSIKGYISSAFLLPESDFKILNSIWGDNESKEVINTGKCRIALLNYIKTNNSSSWQVFSKTKDSKYNSSYYKRVANTNSKFTDFAVIIRSIQLNQRKCLLFSFDDDETPHLIYEEESPLTGDIFNISREYNSYHITYR